MAIKFGDNLKRIRTEKNLSQGELAGLLGMHATHLSRYERDVALPSVEVLAKIAEKLDVTTDMLIYGSTDDKVKSRIKDNDLLNMFSKVQALDKNELNCVKSLLEAYIFKKDLQHQLAK
jgi:transcriptional regulator with XRE-family HTH domain